MLFSNSWKFGMYYNIGIHSWLLILCLRLSLRVWFLFVCSSRNRSKNRHYSWTKCVDNIFNIFVLRSRYTPYYNMVLWYFSCSEKKNKQYVIIQKTFSVFRRIWMCPPNHNALYSTRPDQFNNVFPLQSMNIIVVRWKRVQITLNTWLC